MNGAFARLQVLGVWVWAILGIAAAVLLPHDRLGVIREDTAEGPREHGPASFVDLPYPAAELALFRHSRRPASVPYADVLIRTVPDATALPEELGPPAWTLSGIVWGQQPMALVKAEGQESTRLLAPGDGLEGFLVRDIGADSILVARGEATWTIFVARPWSR